MDILKTTDFLDKHITDAQELITKHPGLMCSMGRHPIRGGSGFSYGVGSRVLALDRRIASRFADAGNIKMAVPSNGKILNRLKYKGASSVLNGCDQP